MSAREQLAALRGAVEAYAAALLSGGDHTDAFKRMRRLAASAPSAADFSPAPPRPDVDVTTPQTWRTCDGVVGCKECGKPMALVGDAIHPDRLCPWCRATHLPHITRKYLDEEARLCRDGGFAEDPS